MKTLILLPGSLCLGFVLATSSSAQLADGSFEEQSAGGAVGAPWATSNSFQRVAPDGVDTDGGMPREGTQWASLSAHGSTATTPPDNPGGVTSPSAGGRGILQSFSYGDGGTQLSFSAAFVDGEGNGLINDWMSVDVTDGATTVNLYYMDSFTAASLPPAYSSGFPDLRITPRTEVAADLETLFPDSTGATVFSVSILLGNGTDGGFPSHGYVDDFQLGAPAPTIVLGDRVLGNVTEVEGSSFRFEATAGTLLTMKANRTGGDLQPGVQVTAPSGAVLLSAAASVVSVKAAAAKKLNLTETGVYSVEVVSQVGSGSYMLRTKAKPVTKVQEILTIGGTEGTGMPFVVDAVAGTVLKNLTVVSPKPKGDFAAVDGEPADLFPVIQEAMDPMGAALVFEAIANKSGKKLSAKNIALPESGSYVFTVGGADASVGFAKVTAILSVPKSKNTVEVP